MSKIGILLANASHAKFICYHGQQHTPAFEIIEEFTHDESRLKRQELVSDRPGHYKTRHDSRGAYGEDHDPKEATKEQFAIELAKQLNHYRQAGLNKFLFITPAHFCGLLEKHLAKEIQPLIFSTLHKDYTEYSEKELLPILHEQLFPKEK